MEQYDLASLRRKYRRKLCSLLFGPEVDVEVLKRSISKSELFGEISGGLYKNGQDRKSSDFDNGDGELRIHDSRRDGSTRMV